MNTIKRYWFNIFSGIFSFYIGIGGWEAARIKQEIESDSHKQIQVAASEQLTTNSPQSYIYDGTAYKDMKSLIAAVDDEQFNKLFGWMQWIPIHVIYVLAACSFGCLGANISIVYDIVRHGAKVPSSSESARPLLGAGIGLMTLAITQVLPRILLVDAGTSSSTALICFSLFAGANAETVYKYFVSSATRNISEKKTHE